MNQRSPLLQRSMLALLSSEVISSIGAQMTFLALPWFVLTTTGSTTRMGIVLAAELLPIALLGIPSGTVVARLGARRTMLVCDLARIPIMAAIPLLHSAGMLSFGLLLVLVFALGTFIAPYFSAQRLVLPELVGEDPATLTQANAVVETGSRLTILLGPVFAGLLIASIGAANVLYVDAATYAVSFLLLLLFVPNRPPLPAEDGGRGVLAGLRFMFQDSLLRPMLLTIVFLHMFAQSIIVALPVLAFDHYGASAKTAGLLFGAWGAGSIIGSLAAIPLAKRMAPLTQATIGVVWVSMPLMLLGLALARGGSDGGAVRVRPWRRGIGAADGHFHDAGTGAPACEGDDGCHHRGHDLRAVRSACPRTPARVVRRTNDSLRARRRAHPHGRDVHRRRPPCRAAAAAGRRGGSVEAL